MFEIMNKVRRNMKFQENNLSSEMWSKFTSGYSRIEKRHMKKMSEYAVTIPQFNVLKVLLHSGSMPLKKISNELNVTGANITCVVDNLEKREFVSRIPSTVDRRIINAELTEKGKEMINSIFPTYLDVLEKATTNFAETEKKEFIRLLEKLVA